MINPLKSIVEIKDEDEIFRNNRFLDKELEIKPERYHSYDPILNPLGSPDKIPVKNSENNEINEKILEIIQSKAFLLKSIENLKPLDYTKPKSQKITEINSPEEGHFILKRDWLVSPTGDGLVYINKKVLQAQKNMLSYLIKRLGSNILQGKSISSISFPIELYDTCTELETQAKNFRIFPFFLEKASKCDDPLTRFKLLITASIATMHLGVSQKKPFNSGIGETYQAIINGCPLYLEQIKAEPSTSLYQMYGNGFKLTGYNEIIANLNANSCLCRNQGRSNVCLSKYQEKVSAYEPFILISGTAFGKRVFNFEGKKYVFSEKNRFFAEILFNPDKKSLIGGLFSKQGRSQDSLIGTIYEVKKEFFEVFNREPLRFKGMTGLSEYIVRELGKIEGVWHKFVKIDEEIYWKFEEYQAFEIEGEEYPLPSDSKWREDVVLWKMGEKKAQIEMENRNTEEKRREEIRKKGRKNKKK